MRSDDVLLVIKLNVPERELLYQVAKGLLDRGHASFPPRRRLYNLGLIEISGPVVADVLPLWRITDDGKRWLALEKKNGR